MYQFNPLVMLNENVIPGISNKLARKLNKGVAVHLKDVGSKAAQDVANRSTHVAVGKRMAKMARNPISASHKASHKASFKQALNNLQTKLNDPKYRKIVGSRS